VSKPKERGQGCRPGEGVCLDGRGFFARECPACGLQRPCDLARAKAYQALGYDVKVGECVTLAAPDLEPLDLPAVGAPEPTAEEIREVLRDVTTSGERWRQSRGRVFG
jgi:hypothetical protein